MGTQISATTREVVGKKVKTLRQEGQLPVVLYGNTKENLHLTVDAKTFGKVYDVAGSSTLVDLDIAGKQPVKVLIHDVQMDPMTGQYLHADLFQVKLDEKIQTEIPLTFVGESAAVKDLGGNLLTPKTVVNVEAFPQDLVAEIEVDISSLATFDDKLTVASIKAPKGVTILDDAEEAIAVVTEPRSEEELEAELAPTTEEAEAAAIAATEEASTEKPAEDAEASAE